MRWRLRVWSGVCEWSVGCYYGMGRMKICEWRWGVEIGECENGQWGIKIGEWIMESGE